MTAEEFSDQIQFAINAIGKKNTNTIQIRTILKVGSASVVLDIKEIGYDDKNGTIYIETR